MAEGDSKSDISREQAHGHVEPEPGFIKFVRRALRPLRFGVPSDKSVVKKAAGRDPLEDTPQQEIEQLEHEKIGGPGASTDSSSGTV